MFAWFAALPLLTVWCAAFTDWRTGRIPNWLTGASFVLAFVGRGLLGGSGALLESALAVLLVAGPCVLLFARGGLGGGDVKLFAALAAALGPGLGLRIELLSFLLVSALVLVRAIWDGVALRLVAASGRAALHVVAPARFARPAPVEGLRTELRLGPFIALACTLVLWEAQP